MTSVFITELWKQGPLINLSLKNVAGLVFHLVSLTNPESWNAAAWHLPSQTHYRQLATGPPNQPSSDKPWSTPVSSMQKQPWIYFRWPISTFPTSLCSPASFSQPQKIPAAAHAAHSSSPPSLRVFSQLLSVPKHTSLFLCRGAKKPKESFLKGFLREKDFWMFTCPPNETTSQGLLVQYSSAPVFLLLLLQQVNYEILQWTRPQIIDKLGLGKCATGCLAYNYSRGQM